MEKKLFRNYFKFILIITATIEITNLIEENKLPKIPIIACTAFDNASDIKKCYEAGM